MVAGATQSTRPRTHETWPALLQEQIANLRIRPSFRMFSLKQCVYFLPSRRPRSTAQARNSSSALFRARHSGAPAALRLASVRCGRRRLGSRAIGRLWRFVARARPFARIALRRRLRSRHRRPCRATTCADSFLHSRLSPALRSRACARATALAPLKRVRSAALRQGE